MKTALRLSKMKSTSIASLHENGSEENLKSFKGIGKVKMVQVDAVLKIIISPYRLTRKSTITLKTNEGSWFINSPIMNAIFYKGTRPSFRKLNTPAAI